MKQQIISGLKKKLLLVELPEGANRVYIFHDIGRPYISYFIRDANTGRFYLEEDVEIICKLMDITEYQCEGLVEWIEAPQYYKDYRKEGWQGNITAQESFFSKLEADGISWEGKQEKVWDISRCWVFEIIHTPLTHLNTNTTKEK